MSPKGETTLGRVNIKKKSPKDGQIIFDDRLGHPAIAVNFTQIADYLEDTLPDGRNDPKFFEKYGKMVNQAFMRLLGKSIRANFEQIRKENPEIINSEIWSAKLGAIAIASNILFYVVDILTGSGHINAVEISAAVTRALIVYNFTWGIAEMFAANSGNGISFNGIPSAGKYREYLESLPIPEQFYPRNLTRFLLVPYMHFATWDKPLIRKKEFK